MRILSMYRRPAWLSDSDRQRFRRATRRFAGAVFRNEVRRAVRRRPPHATDSSWWTARCDPPHVLLGQFGLGVLSIGVLDRRWDVSDIGVRRGRGSVAPSDRPLTNMARDILLGCQLGTTKALMAGIVSEVWKNGHLPDGCEHRSNPVGNLSLQPPCRLTEFLRF
ncbi:hypothetical protein BV22DRAFT_934201 [Leucogyrophana mollusca]|uniref:Uncharacterized protein n=1 Tax=Leucogyrophana mollusca TaxID=85980 RepID=A0ACB8AWE3_9AGAM|nr:hypothetical protein BV22DRAFT_934201 [Leucogyrophana mollusca]